jgi:SAM-dependent methyltransferase
MGFSFFSRNEVRRPVPPAAEAQQVTATRATLSEDWQARQKKLDWMHAPSMASYVNQLVSGKPLSDGGHWSIYAREKHVEPLMRTVGRKLSMVSLACGSGHIERSLLVDFQWPIGHFVGLEFDKVLRDTAEASFRTLPCQSRFEFFDFNKPLRDIGKFDIVFTCHSIHHANDVDQLLATANRLLRGDGLFIGTDFFGPTRFQIDHEVLPILNELFESLPPDIRKDLRSAETPIAEKFSYDTIDVVKAADPSESVRSSDLRTLLFSSFPVVEVKPMGGTILRWLLQYRAGNFDEANPDHRCIVKLLQVIERELIESRRTTCSLSSERALVFRDKP